MCQTLYNKLLILHKGKDTSFLNDPKKHARKWATIGTKESGDDSETTQKQIHTEFNEKGDQKQIHTE